MDRQSRHEISKHVGAWPAVVIAAALAGCSNYRPSDALSALRQVAPVGGFAKAVSQETTAIGGLIQDSLPVYIGTTAKSFLKYAQSSRDPNIRYLAYSKLGDEGLYNDDPNLKAEVVQALVPKLTGTEEPLATRAVIIRTLGILGDPRARDAIARSVNDPEAVVRAAACRALGRVGRPEDATLLVRVMTVDMVEDCRIAAIEGIGALKTKDRRVHQVLIEGMDHEDPAIRLSCYRALKEITEKDVGNTPGPWRHELLGEAEPAAKDNDPKKDAARQTASSETAANKAPAQAASPTPAQAASPSPAQAASPSPSPSSASSWSRGTAGAAAPSAPATQWASAPASTNTSAKSSANRASSAPASATAPGPGPANGSANATDSANAPATGPTSANGSAFTRLGDAFSRMMGRK